MTALDPWREPPMGLAAYCPTCKTHRLGHRPNGNAFCAVCDDDNTPDRTPLPDSPGDRRAGFERGEGPC